MCSHVIIFDKEYNYYIYSLAWIWACDRFLRLVRLIYCNLHVCMALDGSVQYTRSTAVYDRASDVIRVVVTPGSCSLPMTPGQYYYLYQPFRFKGWESHPFTLGAWTFDDAKRRTSPRKPYTEIFDPSSEPLISSGPASGSVEPSAAPSKYKSQMTAATELRPSLIFWIRPFEGFTRSLRDQCLRSPDLSTDSKILVEGPYGDAFPIWEYESVLLIAGGTGIAAAVPYIQAHMERSDEMSLGRTKTRTDDLHLVWSCRQRAFIQDIAGNELRRAFGRQDFRASVYETRRSETAFDADAADETVPAVDIVHGRPNLRLVVMNQAALAAADGRKNMVVVVCGPSGMANEAREAVYAAVKQGYRDIRYVEESFSW